MTDKKKLDEAAILNVQTNNDGMTGETTFVADDALALVQLLKSAGIQSQQFNGPATLSVEVQQGTASMTSRVSAPDLRSIMTLLEPEFQMAGDMESGIEDMTPEQPEIAPEEPVEGPADDAGAVDATVDADGNLELADPEMGDDQDAPVMENEEDDVFDILDYVCGLVAKGETEGSEGFDHGYDLADLFWKAVPYEKDNFDPDQAAMDEVMALAGGSPDDYGFYPDDNRQVAVVYAVKTVSSEEVEEEADYDYRDHGAHPAPYAGKSSKDVVQPDTKAVPAKSGDNPLREKSFADYVRETAERNYVAPPAPVTAETLLDEFRIDELSNDTKNSYFKKAAKQVDQHAHFAGMHQELGNDEMVDLHHKHINKRVQGMKRAIAKEAELDEAGRADWQSKVRQYGEPYYLNTDCGYSSLDDIMSGWGYFDDIPEGLAQHATKIGFTVLEIDRNGKKGYNYINSPDNRLQPGAPVTCVTQTSTGQKFRPGKFITSFNTKDLSLNYDQVVAELAKYGITPSKKLPVKTFD